MAEKKEWQALGQNAEKSSNVQILSQIQYAYKPMENITVYELALIIPILILGSNIEKMMKSLPPEVKRHFKEI